MSYIKVSGKKSRRIFHVCTCNTPLCMIYITIIIINITYLLNTYLKREETLLFLFFLFFFCIPRCILINQVRGRIS